MDHADFNDDMEDIQNSQSSQQYTQSTQEASQTSTDDNTSHLWGYLRPFSAQNTSYHFLRSTRRYRFGRKKELNDCVLLTGNEPKISGQHCIFTWDGLFGDASVRVEDKSRNGTFINGKNIGQGSTCILRDGNVVAFGPGDDYSFVYRHTAKPPITGLTASYDMLFELGRGSYGVVRKAICRTSGEYVAVKTMKSTRNVLGQQNHPPRRNMIDREIDILQKLAHENICELKEVFTGEDIDDIHIVLEFVEGGDLLAYLLKHSPLGEVDSQHITFQICDALSYIHSHGITHRDLKPENVLLTADNPPRVKIADFGLAKFVDGLTMLRTMCGSPGFLAPEVVIAESNSEVYDSRVDSWSVGVIVLTNCNPFIEDRRLADVRTRILSRTIDWSPVDNEAVSFEGINFLHCLLESDPRQRITLRNSLDHPWLKAHLPIYGRKTELDISVPTEAELETANHHVDYTEPFVVFSDSGIPLTSEGSKGTGQKGLNKRGHSALSSLSEESYLYQQPVALADKVTGLDNHLASAPRKKSPRLAAHGVENEDVVTNERPASRAHRA